MASQQAECTFVENQGHHPRKRWLLKDGTTHLSPIAVAVASDWADVQACGRVTLTINNTAGTFTCTIQGSHDGVDWYTIAGRVDASVAYAVAAISIVGAGTAARELSPDSYWRYVRLNVTAVGSATCLIYAEGI